MLIECPDGTVLEDFYVDSDLDGEFRFLDDELGMLQVNGWTVDSDPRVMRAWSKLD
ncbi:MAG: hypothetical protein JKY60_02795 [Kordiimonadaceae bacterium]|nr:hypothetical protein [Kordiimonadaceae bacterium]